LQPDATKKEPVTRTATQGKARPGRPLADLNIRQQKAITSLLSESTLQEAANKAGVNPSTIWRWMQSETFREAYRGARRDAVMRAVARLQHATETAVDSLVDVMKSSENTAARVSAARCTLELAIKATEIEDLDARVTALEKSQNGNIAK
jgi:DNA-binding MurR/RpiR family transcriptional regulator